MTMQNRAYAVSQLADLHQKLSRAQSSVPNTRAPTVTKDEKQSAMAKVCTSIASPVIILTVAVERGKAEGRFEPAGKERER